MMYKGYLMPRYNRVNLTRSSLTGFAPANPRLPLRTRALQAFNGLSLPSLHPTPTPMES